MKRAVMLLCGGLVFASAFADIRALTPVPQSADPNGWWMKRFEEKRIEREAFATNGAPKVVFLGDSITHGWEAPRSGRRMWSRYFSAKPFKGYCLGYGGDRTEHVLWRIDHGELDGYAAKAVVLMIGTNNTGHFPLGEETPIDTICGIKAIIDRILAKQPRAKILLCAIFPRGMDANDPLRVRNEAVNRVLRGFCDSWRIVWCDFNDRFLYADGRLPASLMSDYLHPGDDGYCIWANLLLPVLSSAVRGDPIVAYALPGHLDPARFPPESRPAEAMPRFRYTPTHPRMGDWWWMRRLAERRERIAKSGGHFDLVLLGDSITHYWETRSDNADSYAALTNRASTLNCGYAGDMTQDLLWRVQNGELDGYEAKTVAVEIGTNNNTEKGSHPQDVAAGVKAVLAAVREKQPKARIVLHPIFPRGFSSQVDAKNNAWHAPAHRRNLETNRLIRELADGKTVFWVDFNDRLADPATGWTTKELMPDAIHPSDRAYSIWTEALAPFLPPKSKEYVTPPIPELHDVAKRKATLVSSLAVAPCGRLWATWYAGISPGEDQNNYVVLATSDDDGLTWREVFVADPDGAGPERAFDPEVWLAPDNSLRWTWANRIQTKGTDGSKTASDLMMVTIPDANAVPASAPRPRKIANGPMMCKPTALKDGTWAFPVAEWGAARSSCLYASTDSGRTFSLRGAAEIPADEREFDEHIFMERRNGDIVCYSRTKKGFREALSRDGGRTWGESRPSVLPHPTARMFMRKLASGAWLCVKHGGLNERTGRSHLTAFVSDDEGATWKGGLLLEERSGCSYPDGQQAADGRIYITYDYDRYKSRLIYFCIFTEDDVRAGRDVSGKVRLRQVISQGGAF